ncbi:MAG TPA: hypothetical protein DDZ79_05920 [Aequorivita sp.]|nr:hypothetical protein [Aequorivita sp.]|tara:strand:- start:6204 stop:6986 length:783 start_codon:yes stop_codon:yes gene_type:complete
MKKAVKNFANKREDKKQINIKWNSRLFFQLGVILSLLAVFFIMQTNFEITKNTAERHIPTTLEEPAMIDYVLDIEKPKPIEPIKQKIQKRVPVQKVVKSNVFDVKDNEAPVDETPIADTDMPIIDAPIIEPQGPEKPLEPAVTRTVLNVEFVPVYPGCEALDSNAEKIECMSSKINAFINKNFRKEILENLNPNEAYRIYVKFKIDSNGYIADVMANSHNTKLKMEAQRVINNLPVMKHGKQGDKNVDVVYTVPIVFNIH